MLYLSLGSRGACQRHICSLLPAVRGTNFGGMPPITAFFPPKGSKKRTQGATEEVNASSKKAHTSTAAAAVGPAGADSVAAGEVRPDGVDSASEAGAALEQTLQEAPAARPQLSQEELKAAADKATAVARLRVEQAAAQGIPLQLADLLVEETWRERLGSEFKKPYMSRLQAFLQEQWAAHKIFPPQPLIFRALNGCPIDQARVVILGQDPYHNDGQAVGLSFSVPPRQAVPSSLQNIYKELKEDCGCYMPGHGDLEKWTYQGVLLLNAALTVRAHEANSHAKKGWEDFTNAAITALSAKRKGLVFLLWGKGAQNKAPLINRSKHHVLMAAHPSGLSANRGFFGCKHFSKANKLLEKEGFPPIDWQIPRLQ